MKTYVLPYLFFFSPHLSPRSLDLETGEPIVKFSNQKHWGQKCCWRSWKSFLQEGQARMKINLTGKEVAIIHFGPQRGYLLFGGWHIVTVFVCTHTKLWSDLTLWIMLSDEPCLRLVFGEMMHIQQKSDMAGVWVLSTFQMTRLLFVFLSQS